jgi:hypothetical protein
MIVEGITRKIRSLEPGTDQSLGSPCNNSVMNFLLLFFFIKDSLTKPIISSYRPEQTKSIVHLTENNIQPKKNSLDPD